MTDAAATRGGMREVLAWIAYPVTMGIGFVSFLWLNGAGFSLQSSGYLAVTASAAMVTVLELVNPHLPEWRGRWEDVRSDILYMVIVQMLLPLFLGITLSVAVLRQLQGFGWEPSVLWPHHWPIGFQVALMLLAADFLRYWLHVAAHRYEPLWRLHAVHHAPDKLYWLNVGRFHPVEKSLQYLLDALPFVLVGVGEDVLALYFVFYGTNGFFQHSNIELRFGLLNYFISSAELHRWHHSQLPEESNRNYGNNLIVWDVLFGTRFLPDDRQIRNLGLPNPDYPMGFRAQMKTPLIKGIEQRDSELLGWKEVGLNILIWLRMTRLWLITWHRMALAAEDPKNTQSKLLQEIIKKNSGTQFGQDHRFASIDTIAEYRERVPVQNYEDLRPYIEAQERDGSPQLTVEPPVMYTRTSGTTGEPKFIPILRATLEQLRDAQKVFACIQFRAIPGAYYGRCLAIASPAMEGHTQFGAPFGSASGHIYKNMPGPARAKYVLPWQVFEIEDYDLKYLLIVRLALAERNITHMASANPSTFLKLAATIHEYRSELLSDIRAGGFARAGELPNNVRQALRGCLSCTPDRLTELEDLLAQENPTIGLLWPYLRLLTTWTGGSCRTALSALRPLLPQDIVIADPGYMASEFRGSITVDLANNLGLPTLTENVFEFVERQDWESRNPSFLSLNELEIGGEYYVIVTTSSGLYRYFINDIIKVTGRFRKTPTIEFLQKGKGVTNITGEKLYESQVIAAVNDAGAACDASPAFFIVLADANRSVYQLMVEPTPNSHPPSEAFRAAVEHALCEANIEYKEKLASGRLHPLELVLLRPGTREAYKRSRLVLGQREGQFKEPALKYLADFNFAYQSHLA